MAVPEGYFYKDNAYWNIDGSGPYGIMPDSTAVPLSAAAANVSALLDTSTPGTYTVTLPYGTRQVWVDGAGAGGAGGGALNSGGGGAGGGGAMGCYGLPLAIPAGITQLYVVVPAGGTGGTGGAAPTVGTDGADLYIRATDVAGAVLLKLLGGKAAATVPTNPTGGNSNYPNAAQPFGGKTGAAATGGAGVDGGSTSNTAMAFTFCGTAGGSGGGWNGAGSGGNGGYGGFAGFTYGNNPSRGIGSASGAGGGGGGMCWPNNFAGYGWANLGSKGGDAGVAGGAGLCPGAGGGGGGSSVAAAGAGGNGAPGAVRIVA